MVQIIGANPRPSFAQSIAGGLAESAPQAFQQHFANKQQQQQMQMENQAIKQNFGIDLSGISNPEQRKAIVSEMLKGQGKEQLFKKKQDFLGQLFGGGQQNNQTQPDQGPSQGMGGIDTSNLTDEQIAQATAVDPNLGRSLQHSKDVALREKREQEANEQRKFESERTYQTQFSKEAEKNANQMREVIPKKEGALNFARNAVETGELGYFTPDKLADATGIDLFRTAKGAQLATAGKENLLSNMGRVSARAQNIWFEQRLNSMFPKIGQSKEANLTVQEMLEGELALDKAYLNEFDKLSEQDQEKYGFVKKDITKRARDAVKPLEKEILKRTTYRMKEIEEEEKGLPSLKSAAGKNVPKGTPLTLAMAKIYKEKFGDNALKVAETNGYYIPTLEEFKIFQQSFQEREF